MGARHGIITDVQVEAEEQSPESKYIRPLRLVKILTDEGTVIGPYRAATDYEFEQKQKLPSQVPIHNKLVINSKVLNMKELNEFLTKNKYTERLISKTRGLNVIQDYSSNIFNFILTRTGDASLDAVSSAKVRKQFVDRVLNLQFMFDYRDISVPFMNLPLSTYQEELTVIKTATKNSGAERNLVPVIDMRYDNFEELVDYCIDKLSVKAISIPYSPVSKAFQTYFKMKKYNKKNIAFFMIQVPRDSIRDIQSYLSATHFVPFFACDVYAIARPTKAIPKKGKDGAPPPPLQIGNLKFFDKSNLLIRSSLDFTDHWSQLRNAVLADVEINDKSITEVIDNFNEATKSEEKYGVARALTKVHELKASTSELESFRKFVKSNESKDYLNEKTDLKNAVSKTTAETLDFSL